jgi:hypothetical protein
MLNRRHKVILFIALVAAGSGLLTGATLKEGLGILMLGAALAWVAGSGPAFRACHYLLSVPGRTWPFVRVLVLMAFGGCLLVAVAFWSHLNSFLAVAAISLWAILISPFMRLPTQARTGRFLAWAFGFVAYLFGVFVALVLIGAPAEHARLIGREAGVGMIALLIGVVWLAKGRKLVLAGISVPPGSEATEAERVAKSQGTKLLYLSLCSGMLFLTALLGVLAFLGFTNSVFPMETAARTSPSSNPASQLLFLMLLAWWPYAAWKRILEREPNTVPSNFRRHKRITMMLGALFIIVLSMASAFGLQNGQDRKLTTAMEQASRSFQDVGRKIGAIRSRSLQTTQDYIQAYEEIGPLQVDFAHKLQHADDLIFEAKQRNKERGPFNIQFLYGNTGQKWLEWDEQTFKVVGEEAELLGQEVQVIKQMAGLPRQNQVEFWKKHFVPLLRKEDSVRQNVTSLMKREPGAAKE